MVCGGSNEQATCASGATKASCRRPLKLILSYHPEQRLRDPVTLCDIAQCARPLALLPTLRSFTGPPLYSTAPSRRRKIAKSTSQLVSNFPSYLHKGLINAMHISSDAYADRPPARTPDTMKTRVILLGIGYVRPATGCTPNSSVSSGATCSGKTTLAKHLRRILPNSVIIHQDVSSSHL